MSGLVAPLREATWRLFIAYDGTNFCGWQKQAGQRSVEETLQAGLEKITKTSVELFVAGRTDAGVHATGQVASVSLYSRFDSYKLLLALSTVLPSDMAVWRADEVPPAFDARRHAVGKRYVYRIYRNLISPPLYNNRSWHVRRSLDVDAMKEAAAALIGELDYESFRSASCEAEHGRRTIWRVGIDEDGAGLMSIDVRGNAFCRHMVRIIVGTLVDVGTQKLAAQAIPGILLGRDRRLAGMTAPAHGLTLESIYYPDSLEGADISPGMHFPRYPVTEATWPFSGIKER